MKSHDSYENDKFVNKRRKGVILQKEKKYYLWFALSTCPPGQVLAGPDMSKVRVLVQFRTFRVQNLFFDEVSR